MFKEEISNYNSLLIDWVEQSQKVLEKLLETDKPRTFRFIFKELLVKVLDFEKLWNELYNFAYSNFPIYLENLQQMNLTPPTNFVLGDNEQAVLPLLPVINQHKRSIQKNTNFLQKKFWNKQRDNTQERELPGIYIDLIGKVYSESEKAYKTFIVVCEELIRSVEKYKTISYAFFDTWLKEFEKILVQIREKLNTQPPPDINEINPLLQKYSEMQAIWEEHKIIGILHSSADYINQLQLKASQGNLLNMYNLVFPNPELLANATFENFPDVKSRYQNIILRRQELEQQIRIYGIIASNAPKVLRILEQMNPEFPVYLQRLTELTMLEKRMTEDALKYVLAKTPELGKYDELSQILMFTKPNEVGEMIDSLLKEYDSNNSKL